jgi:hypothetical protein
VDENEAIVISTVIIDWAVQSAAASLVDFRIQIDAGSRLESKV